MCDNFRISAQTAKDATGNMREPASKLKIKVKIQNRNDPHPARGPVVYRWDRIVLALGALALTASAAVWGGWHSLRATSESSPDHVFQIAEAPSGIPAPMLDPAAESRHDLHADSDTGGAISANSNLELASIPETAKAHPSRPTDVSALSAPENAPDQSASETLDSAAAQTSEAETPESGPLDTEQPKESYPATPTTASAAAAEVRILSEHLSRVQLTSGLLDKEPVDQAPALMPMNTDGLIKVYLFTRIEGLKGQTVFHDWYLGDERMARVSIDTLTDQMRASSSKYIDQHMLGKWTVMVRTAEGELLARGEFEVR